MEEIVKCANCSYPIDANAANFLIESSKKGGDTKLLCPNCKILIEEAILKETQNYNMILAVLTGLVGGAIGAIVWYLVVSFTGWQVGIVAIAVGWLVGQGVVLGAGRKRGYQLQVISVILTIIAMLASEYFVLVYFYHDAGYFGSLPINIFLKIYGSNIFSFEGILTLVFYGIAIWQAFVIPAPRKLEGDVVIPGSTANKE
jgi:hypothetical protein